MYAPREQDCYMSCDGSADYNFEKFTTHVQLPPSVHSTCSITFDEYCIAFGFDFHSPKRKSQLNCYTFALWRLMLKKSSDFVWIPSYEVHIIDTFLGFSNIAKMTSHLWDITQRERLIMEKWTTGNKAGDGGAGTSEETILKDREFFRNDSIISICATLSRLQLSLLRQ